MLRSAAAPALLFAVGTSQPPVLPLASRTTTQTINLTNLGGKGIEAMLNITDASGGGSLTVTILARDPTGSGAVTAALLTGAALLTTGLRRYVVHPQATVVANLAVANLIGHDFQIVITVADANPMIYSLSVCTIP